MAAQAAALNWLDSSATTRVIVDNAFRILWANKAALRVMESKPFFENREGIFTLINSASMAAMEAEAIKLQDNDMFVQAFSTDHTVSLILVLRVLPGSTPDDRLYGLELRLPNAAEIARYAGYESCFGVTKAENRVLKQLLKGNNVEKCAAALNISIETVRSHIRQLYVKMNVSSREALFSVMLPFRVQ